MKIIIIGNGKVGYTLAQQLSSEKHDLTIIDQNFPALQKADSNLDVMCVSGNGASISVLIEAGVRRCDLVIAVTNYDEVNIMCCLMAKKLGAQHTIARIRNPEYYKDAPLLKKDIGLDMVINPEFSAAQEISRILRFPDASNVESFARGLVEMMGFRIEEGDRLAGIPLHEFNRLHPNRTLLCAVQRGNDITIPNGNFTPMVGDMGYIIGSPSELNRMFRELGRPMTRIKEVTVIGGSRIAIYLELALAKTDMHVRIVEKDPAKCQRLSETLPKALIIQGDGTDHEILESENAFAADAFITLTGRDEENLLMALNAMHVGIGKVVAKMTRPNYISLVRDTGLDSIISPKDITANQISSYVRAMANSEGSVVESIYKLLGDRLEAVEFTANASTRFLDTALKDLTLRDGLLIAAIVHGSSIVIPCGSDKISEGDRVIVVAKSLFLQDLNDILK